MGFCVCLVPVPLSHFTSLTYPRRTGGKQFHMVVTRKDTLKSGWTPYVYYITLYSIPREYLFFLRKVGKSEYETAVQGSTVILKTVSFQ